MFKNMTLRSRLLLSFLAAGLLPFAIVAIMSLNRAEEALSTSAFNQLQGVREIKKAQIENFFAERKGDMGVLVEIADSIHEKVKKDLENINKSKKIRLESYFSERLNLMNDVQKNLRFNGGVEEFSGVFSRGLNSPEYQAVMSKRHPGLKIFQDTFGFYDIFLIDLRGNVVFTAAKESDLGENLVSGSLKESGLAHAFRKGKEKTAIIDFSYYEPSKAQACFIATPLKNDAGGLVGVAVFQLSTKEVNAIVQERTGFYETGESYIVGLQDGKTFYRSDRLVKKGKIGEPKAGKEIELALSGKSKSGFKTGSEGEPEVYNVMPLDIPGLQWVVSSTENLENTMAPKDEGGKEDFFSRYVNLYGYYDLFLVDVNGLVFYSASKEADYHTNMLTGKFNDSNLGKLVKKVISTREFGMADFEPYAPSNGEPAAFIAQPIIDKNDNEIEMVVALQLSLKAINGIMQQREGMGETGETYLVGSDKLMRSDSFLDQQNHSVLASFKDPSKGKVDTDGSREALAGKTDRKIIIDYNGNPVLSAYTPVKVGELTWALLAEIDEAEAFKAIHFLKKVVMIIAVVGIVGIILFALWSTRSITRFITAPIIRSVEGLTINSDNVASASKQLSRSSQELSAGATEQAASLEETSSALEEIAAQTRQNAGNAASSADAVKQVAGMVKQSAENAKIANNLACESRSVVEVGAKSMQELAEAMKGIRAGSEKITDIIEVINEITHQTKMLATNAAIEAARAGDQGKGFAVVADEVSKLAENSKNSAKEIAKLIKESSQQAQEGNQMAEKGRQVMSEILDKSIKVADLVSEISAAAEEQAHKMADVNGMVESINTASSEQANGVDQVTKAVTQMDSVTQRNAANAEESAAASEELSAQAEELKHIILDLRKIIGSESANGNSKSLPKRKEVLRVSPLKESGRDHGNSKDQETGSMPLGQLQESLRPRKQIKPARAEGMVVNPSEEIPMRDDFKDF